MLLIVGKGFSCVLILKALAEGIHIVLQAVQMFFRERDGLIHKLRLALFSDSSGGTVAKLGKVMQADIFRIVKLHAEFIA